MNRLLSRSALEDHEQFATRGQARVTCWLPPNLYTTTREYGARVAKLHRLTHPRLDFWVTVEIHGRDGRFKATAHLAEESRDVGVGDTPQKAVRAALEALRERDGRWRGRSRLAHTRLMASWTRPAAWEVRCPGRTRRALAS